MTLLHRLSGATAAAALVAAGALAVATAQAADGHRPPGPDHGSAAAPAQSRASAPAGLGPRAAPKTVTARPKTTRPAGGGDPRVTINSQPVPPGRASADAARR